MVSSWSGERPSIHGFQTLRTVPQFTAEQFFSAGRFILDGLGYVAIIQSWKNRQVLLLGHSGKPERLLFVFRYRRQKQARPETGVSQTPDFILSFIYPLRIRSGIQTLQSVIHRGQWYHAQLYLPCLVSIPV